MKRKLVALDKYHFVFVKEDMSEEEVKSFYRLIYYHIVEHFIEKNHSTEPITIEENEK